MNRFFLDLTKGFLPFGVAHALQQAQSGRPSAYVYDDDSWWPSGTAPLPYVRQDGIAIFEVAGALASSQIPGWFWYANLTYENLTAGLEAAANDAAVEAILLKFSSPGGTVMGCAEAASLIDAMAEKKPIWSHCQVACSAAYWLASATNRIAVDPTGDVGSIGVIHSHSDYSKMLEQLGIKVTMLFAGDHKADGNPYEPLGKEAKQRFLEELEHLRGEFVDAVASYRGVDAATVRATEAKTFIGENAVREGLADETAFSTVLLAKLKDFAQSQPGEDPMAKKDITPKAQKGAKQSGAAAAKAAKAKEAEAEEEEEEEEEEETPAAAATDDGDDPADDEEKAKDDKKDEEEARAARTAERNRISAILGAPEAKGREKLAQHLATGTDMSVKDAISTLSASPVAAEGNPLAAAMAGAGNPKVGAGEGDNAGTEANSVLATMKKFGHSRLKEKATG